jgi:hypothetical protein
MRKAASFQRYIHTYLKTYIHGNIHTYIHIHTQQRARRVLSFPSYDEEGNIIPEVPTQTPPLQSDAIITQLFDSNNNDNNKASSVIARTDMDAVAKDMDTVGDGLTVNVPHWFERGTLSNLEVRLMLVWL